MQKIIPFSNIIQTEVEVMIRGHSTINHNYSTQLFYTINELQQSFKMAVVLNCFPIQSNTAIN